MVEKGDTLSTIVAVDESGTVVMDNGRVKLELPRVGDMYSSQIVATKRNGAWARSLFSDSLLLLRGGGYAGLVGLKGSRVDIVQNTPYEGTVRVSGSYDCWTYRVTFHMRRGSSCIEGNVHYKARYSQAGWLCYALALPHSADCWAYPWVMADRLTLPTNIGRGIGISRPNHIWAKLAGIPAVVWRLGDQYGSIGFPLSYAYEHASLTYNPESRIGKRIGLGWGLARGLNIEDGSEEYLAGREYTFPFQVIVGQAGFEALASEWCRVNRFAFDTAPKYSVPEITAIVADGRRHEEYHGQRRYVSGQRCGKYDVSGYQSGSDDTRIIINLLPRNACIDYGLYLRTGDNLWRERVDEQMKFFAQCQEEDGWFQENWDIERKTFYFQGIEEFGPRPDLNAMSCEWVIKLSRMLRENKESVPEMWFSMVHRCLEWIESVMNEDGSIPMTVVPAGYTKAKVVGTSAGYISDTPGYLDPESKTHGRPSPHTRLLVALLEIESLLGDPRVTNLRLTHEDWVIKNAYEPQTWWGHWNDTGHTVTVYSALKFVEYCIRAYEFTGKERYLRMAAETASWAFFQHVPKQLEWCKQYTRGAMIEQDNYMQYGNDVGDNLIFQALLKLGKYTGKKFFTDMGWQSITTAQMSFNDDPRHPWYGGWNTYVADSTGLTVPFDTDPVTGVATHYNNWPGIWDLWNLPED